jgi:hypothetical protein
LKLCSFSTQNTSPQALLAFKVSVEKSAVILMGLPLYIICFFSLTAFTILSLFSVLVVLMIIYHGEVLFLSSMFHVLEASCTWMGITFSRFGMFSVIILLNILWIPFGCTYSPSSMPMILRFGLWLNWWVLTYSFRRTCLTNSSSVFLIISILSSSSESLLEWPSIGFCVSILFFFWVFPYNGSFSL